MLKYTILYFHILWTRQQPPPACLRSLPVLAAARMTHSSRHTNGETFDSIYTLWAHRTNTDSNIPVAPNHLDGEDLYQKQGINLDHSWVIGKPVYLFDNRLQDNQIMQYSKYMYWYLYNSLHNRKYCISNLTQYNIGNIQESSDHPRI